jgi:hypothetical protein
MNSLRENLSGFERSNSKFPTIAVNEMLCK